MEDKFLSLKELSKISSLSVNRLRQLMDSIPEEPLPYYVVGKKRLVKLSDFLEFMEQRRVQPAPTTRQRAQEALKKFRAKQKLEAV